MNFAKPTKYSGTITGASITIRKWGWSYFNVQCIANKGITNKEFWIRLGFFKLGFSITI